MCSSGRMVDKCIISKKAKNVFMTYMTYSNVAERYLIRFKYRVIDFEESGLDIVNDLEYSFNMRKEDNYIILDNLHKFLVENKKVIYSGII